MAKPAKTKKSKKFEGKLNQFAKNYTSQHGEDGILEYLIANLKGIPHSGCEFGAWDGKFLSNIYTLWHDKKWKALLIEADPVRCEALRRDYGKKYDLTVAEEFVMPKGKGSLDDIFKRHKFPTELGILSIDIDSTDYHIWKNVETLTPWIVVIEHNYTLPPWVDYNDPEGEVFLRASSKAMERLGAEKGYKLVCCTLTNCFFVREDKFDPATMPDKGVEQLYDYNGLILVPSHSALVELPQIPVFFGTSGWLKTLLRAYYAFRRLLRGQFSSGVSPSVQKQLKKAGLTA